MTEIILIRKNPNIDYDKKFIKFLNDVNAVADLPRGVILLVLCDNFNDIDDLGKAVSLKMIDYLGSGGIEVLEEFFDDNRWNYAIMIQEKVCNVFKDYPAYFTYVLGHELGHINIILHNENLHIHACLVENFLGYISKSIFISHWDLPIERFCDKFGIFISESLFSRSQLNKELNQIKEKKIFHSRYSKQIESLLKLEGNNELDFKKLREEIVKLSIPYKSEFIKLWTDDAILNKIHGDNCLTLQIDDYEVLFS